MFMILIIVPRMTLGITEIELVTNIFHYTFNIIRYRGWQKCYAHRISIGIHSTNWNTLRNCHKSEINTFVMADIQIKQAFQLNIRKR